MADHPNILWIITDEQRTDSIGAYGSPWAQTPHLDRLAASGTRLDSAYTPSPVCISARAAVLTGKACSYSKFQRDSSAVPRILRRCLGPRRAMRIQVMDGRRVRGAWSRQSTRQPSPGRRWPGRCRQARCRLGAARATAAGAVKGIHGWLTHGCANGPHTIFGFHRCCLL